jgi:DNA-binding response OmpR family regulator
VILIVEDDVHVSRFFYVNLKMRGHDVVEVAHPQDALAIIRETPPDLMILDIKLPGMNGWELLQVLEDEGIRNFPVIVATASVYLSEDKMFQFPRIVRMLLKPVALSDLLEAISDTLERR